jgi:hypothetical protein
MSHNIQESKKYILHALAAKKIMHQWHDFDSGCCMIDIWKGDSFYVIQIENDSIGFSLVGQDDGFTTIPDDCFYSFEKFSKKFNEILKD